MKHYTNDNLELTKLLLNIENPRFEMGENQRDVIQKMIEDQGDKLYQLAHHIVQNDLNPSDLAIVTPSKREKGRYEVLEGNRRVTALKILSNPALIDSQHKTLSNKIKKLSSDFKKRNIKKVPCVVFDDAKAAQTWIKIKHTGQNNGVGVVEWDTQQQARYEAKAEGKAPNIAIQIIDYLNKSTHFDSGLKAKLKSVPATSLGRLAGDPEFRDFVGLDQKDGVLVSNLESQEIVKPLTKVVTDLLKKDFTVNDIYYKEDRLKYIESFKKKELPDKTRKVNPWPLTKPSTTLSLPAKSGKKSARISTSRKTLIPRDFIVKIKDKRVNKIYHELKNLEISEFENATAVLFRVFLELSMDAYVYVKKVPKVTANSELYKKVSEAANFLESKNILSKAELKPVRTAATNANSILSVNTLNAYVHNRHMYPAEKDLKHSWDVLQNFIEKILEAI